MFSILLWWTTFLTFILFIIFVWCAIWILLSLTQLHLLNCFSLVEASVSVYFILYDFFLSILLFSITSQIYLVKLSRLSYFNIFLDSQSFVSWRSTNLTLKFNFKRFIFPTFFWLCQFVSFLPSSFFICKFHQVCESSV